MINKGNRAEPETHDKMARTKLTARKAAGGKSARVIKRTEREAGGIKKSHRFHPGVVALRQIRKLQKSTDMLIRKLPFQRIVREIAQEFKVDVKGQEADVRWTKMAMLLTQEATESYLLGLMSNANLAAIHCGRIGVKAADIRLAKQLMNPHAGTLDAISDK